MSACQDAAYLWNTGHVQCSDEQSQQHPIRSTLDGWPAKDILIGHAVQMTGVKHAFVGIDEIIGHQHGIPSIHPIDWGIVARSKVSIQTTSSGQRPQ